MCAEHTAQLSTKPSVQVQPLMDTDTHSDSRVKILIKWRYHNTFTCKTTSPAATLSNVMRGLIYDCDVLQALLYVFVNCDAGAEVTQVFCVCICFAAAIIVSCCTEHRGIFFPWRPVRKCLFPCCCLAFPWRPIGMRSLVAAVCKNRK